MELYNGLHIKNDDEVIFEFARNLRGTIVKTHIPVHGDVTYDIQVSYNTGLEGQEVPEKIRLRDVPGRCLIKVDNQIAA